ncbi:hypothetical protein [Scandinavium goeteborgense]|uniref:hypothetical protein n=1 Tax=Scandinavium goeteborgense TaxID=1851514 RepID=UPI00105FF9ED|nr:hypothetical protein [Scandinavium goeteborgense]
MKQNYYVIDPKIRALVAVMISNGFKTFASCEGHGFFTKTAPYVAFYADINSAARLDRMLNNDSMLSQPVLRWLWQLTGGFDNASRLTWTLRPVNPFNKIDRYRRASLYHDFLILADFIKNC